MPLIPISTDKRKKECVLIDKENDELETRKIVRKYNCKILTEYWSTKDNNTASGYIEIEKSNSLLILEQNSEYSWLKQSKVLIVISKPLLKSNQKYILRYKDILPSKASKYNTSKSSKKESNNLVNSLDCNISSGKNSFWIYTDGSLIHEGNRYKLAIIDKAQAYCNMVIFTIPTSCHICIYLDSAAAIA
ncbi:29579_t:CDS:2, partial [Gigaspora margarita]